MKKQNALFIFLIAAIFIVLMLAQYTKPKTVNWKPTYSSGDKNPYGAYILRQELPQLFPTQKIESQGRTIYEVFKRDYITQMHYSNGNVNYIFINQIFAPNKVDFDALMNFTKNGGSVFIAARLFNETVAQQLEIKTRTFSSKPDDSTSLHMENPSLKDKKEYRFKPGTITEYFGTYDKENATILATNSNNQPVLIKQPYGSGYLYLCSTPLVFSNYHMVLNDNAGFVAKMFSYLPDQTVFWDEYYKEGRMHDNNRLRFILSQESLRWAWWVSIGGLLVFIFFEGRRTQRVIPVIAPLPNTTLEFTETVGRLYYQRRNHKNIAEKRIIHFLEFIRTHLHLPTNRFDQDFLNKLVTKTNGNRRDITELFRLINQVQKKTSISDTELLYLSSHIDLVKAAYEGKQLNNAAFFKPQQKFNTYIIFGSFWTLIGGAAALSYVMAPNKGDNMLYLFLAIVLAGVIQTSIGISRQLRSNHYKVQLSKGKTQKKGKVR